MEAARKMNTHYTYADYCTWGDDERWELIDGVPYAMAPAPSVGHQSVIGEIFRQLSNFLQGHPCRVFVAPVDVRLNADDADDTVVQPDVLVVCDESKFDKDGKGIIGAPDFIIEVLSPSSAKRDLIIKKKLYGEYSVREYWAVDPETKAVMTYAHMDGIGYVSRSYGEQDTAVPVEILDGCTIDLTKVFRDLV